MKYSLDAVLTLGLLLLAPTALAGKAARPNVIVILTDDQGYGDLSCHGHPVLKTPAIDNLHDQAIRLTDFHVAPFCTPTRSQLMTGRDSLANGAYCVCSGHEFIRPQLPTIADVFAASGYRTGLFGKWHLGDNFPYRPQDRGFQAVLAFKGYGLVSVATHWNSDYMDPWLYRADGQWRQETGYCTDVFFNEAMRWMKGCADKHEPFLLYLPTSASHWPYQVAANYKQPYATMEPKIAAFYGMIANLDENIARCDAFLKQNGLYDNTILIFMTDNGTSEPSTASIYNAGMRGSKASYYEGGHRVPCFIRWPAGGLRPPGDVDTLATVQDIFPTLVDLCGLTNPPGSSFDGASLVPLLRGEKLPALDERMRVVQCALWDEYQGPNKWAGTVLWDKWRLVKGTELYDLRTDPGQTHDVAAQHPEIVTPMRAYYEQWWLRTEPLARDFLPIHLGSPREPVTVLTSHNWIAPNTADQQAVRNGVSRNGPWHVLVERPGQYEIALRRWPLETKLPITAAAPPYTSKVVITPADKRQPFNVYPAGKALPIVKARLKVATVDASSPVVAGDQAAVFTVTLPAGRTTLQTWFSATNGKELCGAYYVYCRRLK